MGMFEGSLTPPAMGYVTGWRISVQSGRWSLRGIRSYLFKTECRSREVLECTASGYGYILYMHVSCTVCAMV